MPKTPSIDIKRFPDHLPILPVDEVFLLPAGKVGLNISSKPLITLVDDVLMTPVRMLGVVLKDPSDESLFTIGCAGRITAFEEQPNGKMIISITGYCRFSMVEEIAGIKGYPYYQVDWKPYYDDLSVDPNPPLDRHKISDLLQEYAKHLSMDMDWDVLSDVPNISIINFFAMGLPFDIKERQRLLEAKSLEERGQVLMDLVEARINDTQS